MTEWAAAVDLVTNPVLREIVEERARQDAKWGEQNHPDIAPHLSVAAPPRPGVRTMGTVTAGAARYYGIPLANDAQMLTDEDAKAGQCSWMAIAVEELAEALEAAALDDEQALRTEVVQLAAVCVQWAQAIDRRRASEES